VAAYLKELESEGISKDHLLILSDVLLSEPFTWDNANPAGDSGVTVDPSFIPVRSGEGKFGVLRLQRDDCRLDLRLPSQPAPYRPAINWKHVEVRTTVRRIPAGQGKPEDVVLENQSIAGWIGGPTPKDNPLLLHLSWSPRKIRPSGRVYVEQVRLQVSPESADFSRIPFVRDWSIEPVPGQAATFQGGKTQYLSQFVSGLWKTLVETEHPDLGSVYLYFQP
jgi:hypothetical protein